MKGLLVAASAAAAVVVLVWVLAWAAARRLPPGPLREAVAVLPNLVTLVRRLRRDPRVPRSVKAVVVLAGLYVASPIDLIPEFIPVIGPLDDVVVVALAIRFAARRVPRPVLQEAWPGDPKTLDRLLGLSRDG